MTVGFQPSHIEGKGGIWQRSIRVQTAQYKQLGGGGRNRSFRPSFRGQNGPFGELTTGADWSADVFAERDMRLFDQLFVMKPP